MAAMTTVLTHFSDPTENSRKSTLSGHTASKPYLCIEKRRVAEGNQTMAEQSFKVVKATDNADGDTLQNKISVEVIARYPIDGTYTDVTAALAVAQDIIDGDEFANSVATLEWL